MSNFGIVYLIQPGELVGTDRYKIGMSEKKDLSRISKYKKNTRILHLATCINPSKLESAIKKNLINVLI